MIQYIQITDWKSLTDFIETTSLHKQGFGGLNFRGQSNSAWKLASSLMRVVQGDAISEKKAKFYETTAEMEFRAQVYNSNEKIYYQPDLPSASFLVDMQHYSCPTRLLDWSHSPYVALYFAVNDSFENNGALFVWDYDVYNNKMESLYPGYKEMSSHTLLDHTEYNCITIVMATRRNDRISKQQGCFSLSNNLIKSHCDLIQEIFEETEYSGLFKLEIPAELKLEFLGRLKVMNISAASLFSGLDGIGRSIRETLLLRKWNKA